MGKSTWSNLSTYLFISHCCGNADFISINDLLLWHKIKHRWQKGQRWDNDSIVSPDENQSNEIHAIIQASQSNTSVLMSFTLTYSTDRYLAPKSLFLKVLWGNSMVKTKDITLKSFYLCSSTALQKQLQIYCSFPKL